MRDVVVHEVVERGGLIARDWSPCQFVEIVACPRANTFVFSNEIHDSRYVKIEAAP